MGESSEAIVSGYDKAKLAGLIDVEYERTAKFIDGVSFHHGDDSGLGSDHLARCLRRRVQPDHLGVSGACGCSRPNVLSDRRVPRVAVRRGARPRKRTRAPQRCDTTTHSAGLPGTTTLKPTSASALRHMSSASIATSNASALKISGTSDLGCSSNFSTRSLIGIGIGAAFLIHDAGTDDPPTCTGVPNSRPQAIQCGNTLFIVGSRFRIQLPGSKK